MEEKTVLIADFDLNMICNFYRQIDRQGPGGVEETKKALSFIKLPADAKIADIGCGTGGQTITLAQNTSAKITAVDLFPEMIEYLNLRIKKYCFENRILSKQESMEDLTFKEKELDMIWAEGSIYHIGFEKGLKEWRKFLKNNGYIAVTEVSWLQNNRPLEIHKYWTDHYAEIDTISNKVKVMEQCGYIPVATFVLGEHCWTNNFFIPRNNKYEEFLKQQNYNESAKKFVEMQELEYEYYKKYKKYYSYVFYIGQKQD